MSYLTDEDIDRLIDPNDFVGRAPQQITEFIYDIIDPLLMENRAILNSETTGDLNV